MKPHLWSYCLLFFLDSQKRTVAIHVKKFVKLIEREAGA